MKRLLHLGRLFHLIYLVDLMKEILLFFDPGHGALALGIFDFHLLLGARLHVEEFLKAHA
jgi:hypothetical protein